ncbi:hypothetical protein JXB41_08465 [Candidatus Woesearchaeota archaeon]|nr:hypothetical protein [Candidatus Woesearchaeota archaeon]
MDHIINRIIEKIHSDGKDFPLLDGNYKAAEISLGNFHKIPAIKSAKKLIFVDGGSSELFKSPSISLFFNRIYYTIYQNNKRIKNKKYEFYTLIYTLNKNNKLFFKTELFGNEFDFAELEFDSQDKTLCFGKNRANISVLGDVIRRFAELKIGSSIKEEDSVLVMDGTLELKYSFEDEFLKELFSSAKIICGLSKTCSLLTQEGDSLIPKLVRISPYASWYYNPVLTNNSELLPNIYFVKFNKNSSYVFRFDVHKNKFIDEILSSLKENSKDPVFLGYPYGLIEADKMARISNKETERLKMQLRIKLGNNLKNTEDYANTLNAHDVLDNIG